MVIERKSPTGNAFVIMGVVQRLLRETGRSDEWPATREAMQAGDYDNLCRVAEEVSHRTITFTDNGESVEFC
jgi:hypothetical protein